MTEQSANNKSHLSAQEVIGRMAKHDIHNAYIMKDGNVSVKMSPSLHCRVVKRRSLSWTPEVSIDMLSTEIVIPTIAARILLHFTGLNSYFLWMLAATVGVIVGSILLQNKKKIATARLEEALQEDN